MQPSKPKHGLRALVRAAEAWGGARLFYRHGTSLTIIAIPVRQCWACKRWVAAGKRMLEHIVEHARAGLGQLPEGPERA